MTRSLTALTAVAALLLAGSAHAQASGGPDAKGNAPLKRPHTVNDGAAKRGANSFTEDQARKHILNAGYASVSGLAKGDDGVWRGMAVKDGVSRQVALDFKGNVSEGVPAGAPTGSGRATGGPPSSPPARAATSSSSTSSSAMAAGAPSGGSGAAGPAEASGGAAVHHARHRHGGKGSRCANPTPNGAACSGVDKNGNGISDREDRAIAKGEKP